MSTQHWKDVTIPTMGDDLLEAWPKALDTAGIIIPASSVAAARTVLTAADAAGATITTATPAYFDVGGIIYKADGTKNSGVWVMKPVNEQGMYSAANSWSGAKTLAKDSSINLTSLTIPAVPYDRGVIATGTSYGSNVSGVIFLGISIQGTAVSRARFATGDNESASVVNSGTIPAGVDPTVQLRLYGGSPSGGSLTLLSDSTLNRFVASTFPISMS